MSERIETGVLFDIGVCQVLEGGRLLGLVAEFALEDALPEVAGGIYLAELAESETLDAVY